MYQEIFLNMKNEIGNRLKQIRERLNFSVEKLCEIIKEKPYRIRDIEKGKQKCPPEVLKKYLEYFQVNLNWLLTGKGPMWINEKMLPTDGYEDIASPIKKWIDYFLLRASEEEKTWFKIQFCKCFPEYLEWLEKEKKKNS